MVFRAFGPYDSCLLSSESRVRVSVCNTRLRAAGLSSQYKRDAAAYVVHSCTAAGRRKLAPCILHGARDMVGAGMFISAVCAGMIG